MEWNDLIQARHTTFAWDETRVPDRSIIEEVFQEAYQHIPSKNLMFPYVALAYRNDDPELRKEIMTICHRNRELDIEKDPGNPQVLAPWIIVFTDRWVADLERRYEKNSVRNPKSQRDSEMLEIGILSMFFAFAFANRGVQTGYCQNIINNRERAKEIFKVPGDAQVRFIMGVGYGKSNNERHEYHDPRIDAERLIPYSPYYVDLVYPRPDIDNIFKFVE